jgi:two-component system nitrogen regulation response regulator NtrX
LWAHFSESLSRLSGLRAVETDGQLMARLLRHNWPGNVRELRNTVERLLIFSQGRRPSVALLEELLGEGPEVMGIGANNSGETIEPAAITGSAAAFSDFGGEGGATQVAAMTGVGTSAQSLRQAVEEFERQHILERLRAHGGQVAATARELGLERSHLYKKMKKLGGRKA